MNKKDAEALLPFVNDKAQLDRFLLYIELRVSSLKESLVTANSLEDVKRLQGAVDELRRMRSIRNEVLNPKD